MTGSILTVVNWLILAFLFPLVLNAQSITGKVVDVIPLPLPNAPVGLLPVGGDWVTQSAHTAADGTFRFFPVEAGEYMVFVESRRISKSGSPGACLEWRRG